MSRTTKPALVTVLLPVYNGEKYLREAIESILKQTFIDFEFLIINDGSTDRTEEIVLSYNDERIRYIKNETNLRLIATLNKGLSLAKGRYLVRMDADDISEPSRIQMQVDYMNSHPDVGVAGSWVVPVPVGKGVVKYDTDSDMIKIKMLLSCYLNHPSTIIRMDVIRKFNLIYPSEYLHAEDYGLWVKMLEVSKIGMVGEFLLNYRMHDEKIGTKHYDTQLKMSFSLRRRQLERLTSVSDIEFELFNSFIGATTHEHFKYPNSKIIWTANDFLLLGEFLGRMIKQNQRAQIYHQQKFGRFFSNKWKHFCLQHTSLGLGIYKTFFEHNFQDYAPVKRQTRILFFLKALFKLSSLRGHIKPNSSNKT